MNDDDRYEDRDGADDADADGTGRSLPSPEAVIEEIASGTALDRSHLRALSDASDDVLRQMLQLWPRVEPPRRREVLATLQQLAEEDATLDVHRIHLTALRNDDPATRMLAIRGLLHEERPEYLRLLLQQVRDDPVATVRAEVANVLAQWVITMEFGLISEDDAESLMATLRDAVEDVEEQDEVRGRALEALGASSDESVSELIGETYELGNHRLRIAALRAMGRNASEGWLDLLIYHFDDEDAEVRAVAAESAGQLLLDEAVEPLTMLATEDSDEDVQVAAITALGEIANEESEHILSRLMQERSESHIREAARDALAEVHLLNLEMVDQERDSPEFDEGESY